MFEVPELTGTGGRPSNSQYVEGMSAFKHVKGLGGRQSIVREGTLICCQRTCIQTLALPLAAM